MAISPRKSAPPAPVKRPTGNIIILALAVGFVLFFFPAMMLLLVVAMLPSGFAYRVDKRPIKYLTICVASMNFCGAFPSIMELWNGANNIQTAFQMISNILELAVIYAAAAFGWLIYTAVPPVISGIIAVMAQHRIAQLRGTQRDLIKEWGEDIAGRIDAEEEAT
jgi:hypothetical protein